MPGVREGIEQKRYAEAEKEAVRIAAAIDRLTGLLNDAAGTIERGAAR